MDNLKSNPIPVPDLQDKQSTDSPFKQARFLKDCLSIFRKDPSLRTQQEVSKVTDLIESLRVFKRHLLPSPNPRDFLETLTSSMKVEIFPEGSPLFHLDRPGDKLYILLQGDAKEYVPRTLQECEKELDLITGGAPSNSGASMVKTPSKLSFSTLSDAHSPDIQKLETMPKLALPTIQTARVRRSSVGILETVEEEAYNEAGLRKSPFVRSQTKTKTLVINTNNSRGFQPANLYIKEVAPNSPKTPKSSSSSNSPKSARPQNTPEPFIKHFAFMEDSIQQKRSSFSHRSLKRNSNAEGTSLMQDDQSQLPLELRVSENLREEFRKYGNTYFLGRILKIKFKRILKPGCFCGEGVIDGNTTRRSVVVANSECHCISLSRDDYLRAVKQAKNLNEEKIDHFRKTINYYHVNEEQLTTFALFWSLQDYNKADIVFRQSDISKYLYLVCEGEVTILRNVYELLDSRAQNEEEPITKPIKKKVNETLQNLFKIGIVSSGHIFGEKDFADGNIRTFTAVITSPKAKLCQLSLKDLKVIRKTFPDLVQEMLKKTFSQSNWEKDRLEGFYQQNNVDLSLHHNFNKYLEDKKKTITSSLNSSPRNTPPRRLVKPFEKPKRPNLHFEYDRHFVPKPGKAQLSYLETLALKLRTPRSKTGEHTDQNENKTLENSDEWMPFTHGKAHGHESVHRQEKSPTENTKPNETAASMLSVKKTRFTPTMLNFDNISTPSKRSILDLPGSARASYAKTPRETRDKEKKEEGTPEEKSERKITIKVPKLHLDTKMDSPVSTRTSIISTSRLHLVKEKLGYYFDNSTFSRESLANSPLSIKTIEKDSGKESPPAWTIKVRNDNNSPNQSKLSKFRPSKSSFTNVEQPKSHENFEETSTELPLPKPEGIKYQTIYKGFSPTLSPRKPVILSVANHQKSLSLTKAKKAGVFKTAHILHSVKPETLPIHSRTPHAAIHHDKAA